MKKCIYRAVGVAALGLIWLSCSLESPKAPSWDTTLRVPLTDHTYSIEELIQGDDHLRAGADGLLAFHFEQALDTSYVNDYLTFPEIHETISVGLDALTIPNIPVVADRFLWSQLSAEAVSKNGTTGTVAPFTFNRIAGAFHASEDLLFATLTTGVAWLHIYNRLPVPLENIILSLQDPATSAIVVTSPLLRLVAADDSAIVEVDMAGKSFPPQSRWLLSGNSQGSRGGQVAIDGTLSVDVVSELRSFSISSAEARIPALTIDHSETMVVDESGKNAIADLEFKAGRFRLSIDNRTPFASPGISIQFDEIRHKQSGLPLQLKGAMQPFAKQVLDVNLAAYTIHLDVPQAGSPQKMHVSVQAQTADMRSQFITLGAENRIALSLDMDQMVLDHFRGRLEARMVELDSTVQNVTVSEEWGTLDGVTVNDARMQVTFYTTIEMPIEFHGALYGFNDRGESALFPLNVLIAAPNPGQERATVLPLFTSQNSSIVSFINLQPTKLAAGGYITVGDGMTLGQVTSTDYVRGRFVLDIPVDLKWEKRSIEGDISQLRIAPENQEGDAFDEADDVVVLAGDATRHMRAVSVAAEIENHLPVGGSLFIHFGTDSSKLAAQPDLAVGPLRIEAAPVNAAGTVTGARSQRLATSINETSMALFYNEGQHEKTIYFRYVVKLDGTGGQKARVYLNDYFRIQALLEMTLRVKESDEDTP